MTTIGPHGQARRVILDLRGLVLHAYYSDRGNALTREGSTGEQVPTAEHAVDQFINIYLAALLDEYAPIEIIAVQEGKNANARRRRIYPEYKVKPEQDGDDEIASKEKALALETCSRLLLHLGATLVNTPYNEADDTVAYLCKRMGGEKRVISRDKDLLALLAPDTRVYISDYLSGTMQEKDEFEGIPLDEVGPHMITLYLSLVGDPSDGYKGVPRFGAKTFIKLLEAVEWEGMDQLCHIVRDRNWEWLQAAVEADPANKPLAMLYANRDAWAVCWELASLHPEWCELNYGSNPVAPIWAKRVPQRENVLKVLAEVGLEDRIEEFEHLCIDPFLMDREWLDNNPDKLDAELELMAASDLVAFDYEAYDRLCHPKYKEARPRFVDVLSQVITGASFAYGPNLQHSFYLPVNHAETGNVSVDAIREFLYGIEHKFLVAHNTQFEGTVSKTNLGYEFLAENFPVDTQDLASHVDEELDKGLKYLSKRYLNYDQMTYQQVLDGRADMRELTGQEVLGYGADDSIVAAHLAVLFRNILEAEGTWQFASDVERYFNQATLPAFIKGIPLNWEKLDQLRAQDAERAVQVEADVRMLLQEHCLQYNEKGYWNIWPEVESYIKADIRAKAAKRREAGQAPLDPALQESRIEERRVAVWEGCRYVPYGPRYEALTQKGLSAMSRSFGLPSIRSLRAPKLADWLGSIQTQADEQGAEFTAEQASFMQALYLAVEDLGGPDGKGSAKASVDTLPEDHVLIQSYQEWQSRDTGQWVGTELNTSSPPQMAMLFYGMLNLPIQIRNTAKEGSTRDQFALEGAPATNDLAMQTWLIDLDEDDWRRQAILLIQELRGLRQRESLYYSKYPLWASPEDGRIHPQFRNCGTDTRRPTGNSPNILQVTKRDGGEFRSVFLPQSADQPDAEPEVIISIDWSQEEIRLQAAVAPDKNLLACYVGDKRTDVHTVSSTEIMNVLLRREPELAKLAKDSGLPAPWTYEDYLTARRNPDLPIHKRAEMVRDKMGKQTVFTMMYGGSGVGLARKLVIPRALGDEFFDAFFKTYPGIAKRQEQVVKMARKHGFIETLFGSRRHCNAVLDKNKRIASAVERKIINFEMQGAAADIAKMTCKEWVLQDIPGKTGATLYAFVYDEIVASVPVSKAHLYIDMMVNIMQITLPGTQIVLEAEAALGPSWGEQVELGGNHAPEHIESVIRSIT